MKKLLLGTLVLLCGCTTLTNVESTIKDVVTSPTKTITNPKCKDYDEIKVFQVLDNYILGDVCEKYEYVGDERFCTGGTLTVYFKKQKGELYYDDQKIQVPDGQCMYFSDTFSYETVKKDHKTVPVIKFMDREIPNPEYKKWLKEQESKKTTK